MCVCIYEKAHDHAVEFAMTCICTHAYTVYIHIYTFIDIYIYINTWPSSKCIYKYIDCIPDLPSFHMITRSPAVNLAWKRIYIRTIAEFICIYIYTYINVYIYIYRLYTWPTLFVYSYKDTGSHSHAYLAWKSM